MPPDPSGGTGSGATSKGDYNDVAPDRFSACALHHGRGGELRGRGWKDAVICLPHDGVATNNITGKRYIDHWREAGFECDMPIKNTGLMPQ
jgi:hypothetical protein